MNTFSRITGWWERAFPMSKHISPQLEPSCDGPPYDLDVLVPLSARDKYAQRLQAFQHHGLLNGKCTSVRLTLLIGEEDRELFENGWNFPVRIVEGDRGHAAARIYDYYAAMTEEELGAARWFLRVDDDSVTDVDGLVKWLDSNYNWEECHYLMTVSCCDILPIYRENAARLGYGHLFPFHSKGKTERSSAHEWEAAVLSQTMMRRIVEQEHCGELFAHCADIEGGFGDHVLALAARMTGFTPAESEVLSQWPEIDNLSLFGGDLFHIHYIAPDLDNWSVFLDALQNYRPAATQMAGQNPQAGERLD